MSQKNNISLLKHEECCGCKVCGDCCPNGSITFRLDDEGFFHPSVDEESCINCGKCVKTCPELNGIKDSSSLHLHAQSFVGCLDRQKERRDTGSSGGVFGLLANHLLDNGYVVCGAAFDERLKLRHQFADSHKHIEKLKKSKYLQSDCAGVYREIKDRLSQGEKVLFVGTPCQCNALLNLVGGGIDNLIVVDFACHGVPSQDLFDRCIGYYEQRHDCKVIGYSFRHKPKRYGSPQNFLLQISKAGNEYTRCGKYYEEPFYCGFQKYLTLRASCYSCKWAGSRRVGDMTLADFWGIENVTDKWDRTDHPSLVILNTVKGQRLFYEIKKDLDSLVVSKEDAVRGNGVLVAPTKMPQERKQFFYDLKNKPFDYVVKNHLVLKRQWTKTVYYAIPFAIRKTMLNIFRKVSHA